MPASIAHWPRSVCWTVFTFWAVLGMFAPAHGLAEDSLAATAENDLAYRWKSGEQYSYRFSCTAEVGAESLEVSGTTTYSVGRPAVGRSSTDAPHVHGSGTAFVVSADGYLLTCDHVVRSGMEIKATLDDQTFPCKIIARDSRRDLALLQIAKKNLVALPLADSEKVELAEEVRAVGYPLTDVLGSSVKITQGSVAGIIPRTKGKVFQIDAVVIPGNSGGPLLDARGAVIGVVNAQLLGDRVPKVGFAVPANDAKALLKKCNVAFQTVASDKKIDGPALAKRVAPSVALLTVAGRGGEVADEDSPALHYHAVFDRRRKPREPGTVVSNTSDASDRDDGQFLADAWGEVRKFRGNVCLPCLLGPLGTVAVDSLPANGEKTWKRQELLAVTLSGPASRDPLGGIRPAGFSMDRQRPLPFGPFIGPNEYERRCPAIWQARYSADKPTGTTVVIHKRLEIRTTDQTTTDPKLELVGSGEMVFDLAEGMPRTVKFSGKLTMREGGNSLNVPVRLRCERTSADESKPASDSSKTPPAKARGGKDNSDADRLDVLLGDLRAKHRDWNKRFAALEELSLMTPVEQRREEVAKVLEGVLADKNYSARLSALRVVQIWRLRENVPAVIRLINPPESESMRRKAMETLGHSGDARAATPLAQRLKDTTDRASALRALCELGPAAEDAVLVLLNDVDADVREAACDVLGEIGGPKSITALKELSDRSEGRMQESAEEAIVKLQKKR